MPDLVKTLLGLGITIGLADREAFVREVSGIISEYQKNPEKADKWANAAVEYLERMRDKLDLQMAIKNVAADTPLPDKTQIERLTRALEELTNELRKQAGNK